MTGDEIVADYGIRDLDFIKMDVEGHEAHVLRGLKHTLQSQRPLIIFEVLEAYAKAVNIGDLLPSDYDLYGNKRGFISGCTMSACDFCRFEYGRTYMSAIAVPREKSKLLRTILPAPSTPR